MFKVNNLQWGSWIHSSIWISLLGGIVLVFLFSIKKHLNSEISHVDVHIESHVGKRNLITEELIINRLEELVDGNLELMKLGHLDLEWMEEQMEADSRIENVELYVDGRNVIHVDVKLKKPMVRIMSNNGEEYYLDIAGERVGLGEKVAVRVPLVTGFVEDYQMDWRNIETHNLHDVFKMANVITQDEFLTALIEQIHLDSDGMITVIPKIGRERIFVGTINDLDFKMENLKLSYKYILKRKGWGKYKELKLDIPNQVVVLS